MAEDIIARLLTTAKAYLKIRDDATRDGDASDEDRAMLDRRAALLSDAAAEIARLREAAKGQLVIVNQAKEALARTERAEAALAAAREFVARDLRSTLECVCQLDRETLEPIESTIDPDEVEHVENIRAVLAQIDAALPADAIRSLKGREG